jgi:hypothetical protein
LWLEGFSIVERCAEEASHQVRKFVTSLTFEIGSKTVKAIFGCLCMENEVSQFLVSDNTMRENACWSFSSQAAASARKVKECIITAPAC